MKFYYTLLLLSPIILFGQEYSNFYGTYDINSNVNIKQDVNVSGNVKKTITTIDYGALAQANAMREQNRLASVQYTDQRERQIVMAIASDPAKAFDYGFDNHWKFSSSKIGREIKNKLKYNKKTKYFYHKVPHKSLFVRSDAEGTYAYENIDSDGITTQIIFQHVYPMDMVCENQPDCYNIEQRLTYEVSIGEEGDWFNKGQKSVVHKVDLKKANVAASNGFVGTLIWEDKYEKCITDNYTGIKNVNGQDLMFMVKVRFKGDRDRVSFEKLEGRRYYLNPLIVKTISTYKLY